MVVSVKGAAKVVKIYNLSRMEVEGIDFSEYDLESKEDVQELFERVSEFVESGEVEAYEPPIELRGVDPDECSIKVANQLLYPDEITLKNSDIIDILADIQEAKVGDIYYIYSMDGDGEWLLESDKDIDPTKLEMGYVDCSIYFDEYDVLREGYLDLICDTVLPEKIACEDARFELDEFIFDPLHIFGQLYKVVEEDGVKLLHKIDFGGRMLAGSDFIVDDFEEN